MSSRNFTKMDYFRVTKEIWDCNSLEELVLILRLMASYGLFLIPRKFVETIVMEAWHGDIVSTGMSFDYQVNWFKYPPNNFYEDVYIVTAIDLTNTEWIPNPETAGIIWKYIRIKELEALARRTCSFAWNEFNLCRSLFNALKIVEMIYENEKKLSKLYFDF